jgi:hypothetical protein
LALLSEQIASRRTEGIGFAHPLGVGIEAVRGGDQRVRCAAVERFESMNVDWAGIMHLEGEAAAEAFGIIAGDVEGQVEWWRERLAEQGHGPEQVDRLVSEYRRAAMRNLRERMLKARRINPPNPISGTSVGLLPSRREENES